MIIKTISSNAKNVETLLYRNGGNFAKKHYYHQQQHKRNHHHETHFTIFPHSTTRTKASSDDAETESEDKKEKTFTETFESFFTEKEESINEKKKRLNSERKKELEMKQRVYDRDGTYVSEEGSDFFKDPEQLKAVAIFCAFLAGFDSRFGRGDKYLVLYTIYECIDLSRR